MTILTETLADIARASSRPKSFADVINESFDFYEHMTTEPTYASRDWEVRNTLLAAYIRETPGDLAEITHYMDIFDADDWARALEGGGKTYSMAWAIVKICAEKAFEEAIDACIRNQFDDYCRSNGIYHQFDDEPLELVGFDMNRDTGDESREHSLDNMGIKRQAN